MSTYFHLTSPDKGLFLVVRQSGQTHMFSHASDFYFEKILTEHASVIFIFKILI